MAKLQQYLTEHHPNRRARTSSAITRSILLCCVETWIEWSGPLPVVLANVLLCLKLYIFYGDILMHWLLYIVSCIGCNLKWNLLPMLSFYLSLPPCLLFDNYFWLDHADQNILYMHIFLIMVIYSLCFNRIFSKSRPDSQDKASWSLLISNDVSSLKIDFIIPKASWFDWFSACIRNTVLFYFL